MTALLILLVLVLIWRPAFRWYLTGSPFPNAHRLHVYHRRPGESFARTRKKFWP